MSSNVNEQSRMFLNMIEQAGHATFEVKTQVAPPSHKPTWEAVVTVTGVSPALSRYIYIGTSCTGFGTKMGFARDAACLQMLKLFADYGIRPTSK
ncbi:hypothetical protein FRC01_006309 [Tulasnella sp. 417]|nr:hypothetical protein FRC01_006309 [Tulasnella sp. 417]